MAKSKPKARTSKKEPLPDHFASLEEAGMFWDTHDSAEYEEFVSEPDCLAEVKRRTYLVPVDSDLYRRVQSMAQQKGISLETLVNMWIQEKAS